jgi:phosphate transport system protein
MSHLDVELQLLKADLIKMWRLVQLQLKKSQEALVNFDKDLAREVIANEKRVNAYELKIDRDCENIFALFNPVAVDLRFVLAVLKINSNLERIGDIAEGISRFIVDIDNEFNKDLLEKAQLFTMFDTAIAIVDDVTEAFDKEDTKLARTVFVKDEVLDGINENASYRVAEYITNHPDQIRNSLHVLSIIRKLERIGDQSKNIAEEIIFYIEAKVLKHRSTSDRTKGPEQKD